MRALVCMTKPMEYLTCALRITAWTAESTQRELKSHTAPAECIMQSAQIGSSVFIGGPSELLHRPSCLGVRVGPALS
jgi:hypothetical protein